jgi:hypothetical protein
MYFSKLVSPEVSAGPPVEPVPRDLVQWLHSGRLTLVDERRQVLTPEAWPSLPEDVRTRAQADFDRVVRGNAKAAVLYLR